MSAPKPDLYFLILETPPVTEVTGMALPTATPRGPTYQVTVYAPDPDATMADHEDLLDTKVHDVIGTAPAGTKVHVVPDTKVETYTVELNLTKQQD